MDKQVLIKQHLEKCVINNADKKLHQWNLSLLGSERDLQFYTKHTKYCDNFIHTRFMLMLCSQQMCFLIRYTCILEPALPMCSH